MGRGGRRHRFAEPVLRPVLPPTPPAFVIAKRCFAAGCFASLNSSSRSGNHFGHPPLIEGGRADHGLSSPTLHPVVGHGRLPRARVKWSAAHRIDRLRNQRSCDTAASSGTGVSAERRAGLDGVASEMMKTKGDGWRVPPAFQPRRNAPPQYSSGNSSVVTLRSHSVMTQSFWSRWM
jgi:hypothetical protein